MGLCIDKGFSHKLAEEVLKDSPNNQAAKDILSKPKFRVNDKYFNNKKECMEYLHNNYPELLRGPTNVGLSCRTIRK